MLTDGEKDWKKTLRCTLKIVTRALRSKYDTYPDELEAACLLVEKITRTPLPEGSNLFAKRKYLLAQVGILANALME